VFESDSSAVVIGRPKTGVAVDLDLTPDELASRPHARISYVESGWWIEDLGSRRGTKVDGEEIRGQGRVQLFPQSIVRIGATMLRLEVAGGSDDPTTSTQVTGVMSDVLKTARNSASHNLRDAGHAEGSPVQRLSPVGAEVSKDLTLSIVVPADQPLKDANAFDLLSADRHCRLLYELLLDFGADTPLDHQLQRTLERLVHAIRGAERGALLVKQPGTGQLLLKAHLPPGQPSVSETLANRAITHGEAFVWEREPHLSVSQIEHQIASGMYAPMIWKGETYGVICVDNSDTASSFQDADLQILVATAQHTALAISNHRLHEELKGNVELVERLLTNFSPAIRRRLLAKARRGRLRLGGEVSEVTILASDIRGFTRIASTMDAEDVVDMLNVYFSALVEAIFRHDGTVDKFIGDAILAVFGSPEPDDDQHSKAVCAAVAMQEALAEVNAYRKARGQVVCELGIGVHCGSVLHGFIGSEERMEFTVIGDAVNKTSRYCDGAAGGQILISPELHQRVWKMVRAEPASIPTKHEGNLPAFRVLGCKEMAPKT
jgi:adenylate cyclase